MRYHQMDIKRTTGVPEGEEREKGAESLFGKIIAENFPNMGKERDIQIQLG